MMETVSQTPPVFNEQVIKDLKFCLNSIKTTNLKVIHNTITTSEHKKNVCHTCLKNDRFLINLYEWPPTSFPTKKIRPSSNESVSNKRRQLDKIKHRPLCDKYDNTKYVFGENIDNICKQKFTMDDYNELQSRRDVECIKIKESSNILRYLNSISPYGHWYERLVAEKMLLESGYATRVLRKKISENYISLSAQEVKIGSVLLSNFKFYIFDSSKTRPKETEFYVLLLSNETDIKSSKIARSSNGEIVFNEEFVFPVDRNFNIKLQIFSISLKEIPKFSLSYKFLSLKNFTSRTTSKLKFRNLNTCECEEIQALKTSFVLCGDTEVNAYNFHNEQWKLNLKQNSPVTDIAFFSAHMKTFKIENRHSGFLDIGRTMKDLIVWNRYWSVLDNSLLKFYKYPSEEDVVNAELVLDLSTCLSNKIEKAPEILCNRPRSFILEMTENNLSINYFFMAETSEDLHSWLKILNMTLDLLKFKTSFKF